MPDIKRRRNEQMRLRTGKEMEAHIAELFPEVAKYLQEVATIQGGQPSEGELMAAARHLTKSMAEYSLRKKKRVVDSKYNPTDEALWREDEHLKDWKVHQKEPSPAVIKAARERREEILKEILPPEVAGGARSTFANAIRHAWLICHAPNQPRYGRQTNGEGNSHTGPLHCFIKRLILKLGFHASVDEIHKLVLQKDKELYPHLYMSGLPVCPDSPT